MIHLILAASLFATPAHAEQELDPAALHPCERELLDDEAAFERNAWAHNCGFLPARQITYLFINDLYVAFEKPGAPCDSEDSCSGDWGQPVMLCPAVVD